MRCIATYRSLVLILFWGILSACTTVQKQRIQQTEQQQSESTEAKIVFLHFVMRSDTLAHRDSVELTDVIIAKGMLKQRLMAREHPPTPGHLFLTAMDEQQRPLQQVVVEHPLRRTVEYLGDDMAFHTTRLDLTEATFFMRLQYYPSMATVRVEETTDGESLKFVADVPLHHIHNSR